jgi:predicted phage baseplate assembly protein
VSLPQLELDDRRFQELVSEARKRIAQTCPEWTEHNVSDPGITLIELFAWMTELLIYRVNRIPEKLHVALLELLGLQLAPPAAASAMVRFRLAAPAAEAIVIKARETEVATRRSTSGEPIVFQVRDDFTIRPLRPAAYAIQRGSVVREVPTADGEARPHADDRRPFATPPGDGDALYLGFEDPLGRLMLRVDVEAAQARGAGIDPLDPPLRWEVGQGDGSWAAAELLSDSTGGFNFGSGAIELQLPRRSALVPVAGRRLYWLRCRLHQDDDSERRYTQAPEIKSITASAIGAQLPVEHARLERREHLGYSDGTPSQTLQLRSTPVLPLDSPRETFEVLEPDAEVWERWELTESFAESGAADRHFTFDPAAGEIELGPSIRHPHGGWTQHGAIPAPGAALRISEYRHGGGREGNVAAGEITVLRTAIPGVASVVNPLPAQGGLDAETLDSGRRRARNELRTRHRAVTVEDFAQLALEASYRVGRAIALEGDRGIVAVHVLPALDDCDRQLTAGELAPPRELLSAVAGYLDERRMLGVTVLVAPVRLRTVSIVCELEGAASADLGRIEIDVRAALYRYLNPLVGGRLDGRGEGWPFGRGLTLGELYGLVQAVRGVEQVSLLRIYETDHASGQRAPRPAGDLLAIEPEQLIASDAHTVKATRRGQP